MSAPSNTYLNIRNPRGPTHRYYGDDVCYLYNQRDSNPREQEIRELRVRMDRFKASRRMTKVLKTSLEHARFDENFYRNIIIENRLLDFPWVLYNDASDSDIIQVITYRLDEGNAEVLRARGTYSIFIEYAIRFIRSQLPKRPRPHRHDRPRLPRLPRH